MLIDAEEQYLTRRSVSKSWMRTGLRPVGQNNKKWKICRGPTLADLRIVLIRHRAWLCIIRRKKVKQVGNGVSNHCDLSKQQSKLMK